MRTRNLLLACGFAIILIGVTAALTFSIAQSTDTVHDDGFYESLPPDVLVFDRIDQNAHDITPLSP